MTKLHRILAALAVVSIIGVDGAGAQVTPNATLACGSYQICSQGQHRVLGPGPGNVTRPHYDCGTCIVGDCHPACGTAANPAGVEVYEELLAAAGSGDSDEVLRLAPLAGEYVVFNRERNAVQLWSCSKNAVIASLPVAGSLGDLAAADSRSALSEIGSK